MNDAADQAGARARDLGVPLDGTPGRHNAITDVAGVGVGYTTLYSAAEGICTGVTAILPRERTDIGIPCAAGTFSLKATVDATEEAALNALINNQDMTGRNGHFSPALPHDEVCAIASFNAVYRLEGI